MVKVINLEQENNLLVDDLLYKEIDELIKNIEKSIKKLANKLLIPKTLEEYLRDFRKEYPNLNNPNQHEKNEELVKFSQYFLKKEQERIRKNINFLDKENYNNIINSARLLEKLEEKITDIEKTVTTTNFFKKIFSKKYHNSVKNLDIYKLKFERISNINKSLSINAVKIFDLELNENPTLSKHHMQHILKDYDKFDNLEKFIKNNPELYKNNEDLIKYQSVEEIINNQIGELLENLNKIRNDKNLDLVKKHEIMVARISETQLEESLIKGLTNHSMKALRLLKDKCTKKINVDKIILSSIYATAVCGIGSVYTSAIKDLSKEIPIKAVADWINTDNDQLLTATYDLINKNQITMDDLLNIPQVNELKQTLENLEHNKTTIKTINKNKEMERTI